MIFFLCGCKALNRDCNTRNNTMVNECVNPFLDPVRLNEVSFKWFLVALFFSFIRHLLFLESRKSAPLHRPPTQYSPIHKCGNKNKWLMFPLYFLMQLFNTDLKVYVYLLLCHNALHIPILNL